VPLQVKDDWNESLGYVCAVALPCVAAMVSVHVTALHETPVALNMVIVSGLALLFGLGPGMVAVLTTAGMFSYYMLEPDWNVTPAAAARVTAIMVLGGLIAWLFSRQRESKLRLGAALHAVREQQDALLRSEKLAAVGRLSATVAHEINNPLESLTNLLYLAQQDETLRATTKSYLDEAEQELKRLANIARHTLTFVRVTADAGPTDVAEVARSIAAMFETRIHTRGGRVRVLAEGKHWAKIPADDLRQMLTNLVGNACDALPAMHGVVEIQVTTGASVVRTVVRDNGAGIREENVGRIFEPFFTTKADVGTGIGLWVTKELAEKHRGRIGVHIEPGYEWSTEFWVVIPMATVDAV